MANERDKQDSIVTDAVKVASIDPKLAEMRMELAAFTAMTFQGAGSELTAIGHVFGTDRRAGLSHGGHGSDEIVSVGLLLSIAGQLVSASSDLFGGRRSYAAAALLRQLVEIEYLAWAFETRDGDAEHWLRSTEQERQSFFKPSKLRAAAQGKFRGKDYGYHCELGGHPTPASGILLGENQPMIQLLMSDLLGHAGRIWDHVERWSQSNNWAIPVHKRRPEMSQRYAAWKAADRLVDLPPPL
jgi:hypothetical protein